MCDVTEQIINLLPARLDLEIEMISFLRLSAWLNLPTSNFILLLILNAVCIPSHFVLAILQMEMEMELEDQWTKTKLDP